MFKTLLGIQPTVFVFLSGLMVSVATSAAAQVAFAESVASNRGRVLTSGALALVAGVFWFCLSESVSTAGRKIDALALALKSRDAALNSLPRRLKILGVSFFWLACAFSIIWPLVAEVSHLLARAHSFLASFVQGLLMRFHS